MLSQGLVRVKWCRGMPIGFIVDTEFLWGFQANVIGLSKTPPSFYYPPPTTFLGALAESIAKDYGIGEEQGKNLIPTLSQNLLAIGVKPLNCFPVKFEDINKIIAVKITGNIHYPNPKNLARSYDAPARGKTLLISLDDEAPRLRWFLIFKSKSITFNGKRVELDDRFFWKIHRIGSKESRVSVVNVISTESLELRKGTVMVNYSFPSAEGISPQDEVSGVWEFEIYVKPYSLNSYSQVIEYIMGKNTLPFLIPLRRSLLREPKYVVSVGGKFTSYSIGEEVVIGYG